MAEDASNLERKPDESHGATDTELLRRYAEDGSEAAFAELVSRHVGLVYAAALRQVGGAAHRAQDVAQTVFVALARQATPLSRRTEIVGWLYTSTHQVAAKLKRTEQRRAQREQEAHAMNEINADNRAAADWDRLRPVLDAAMHGLSDADREAILLRYFQNRRLAEIGRRLGLSEDAVRNLFNSEAPLQPAQADQLIEIMARNAPGPAGKVELVALNVEAAVAQASGVLSPTQLAELRKTADIALAQAKVERERNTAPAASLRRQ